MINLKFLFLLSLFFMAGALIAAPATKPHPAKARLLSEVSSAAAGDGVTIALELTMEPHWHVYWHNSGDSGIPPEIKWELPEGVTAGSIDWPYPTRISVPPLMNFGYENRVLLLTNLQIPQDFKGAQLDIKARANWLVCKETCIPGKADLNLSLPISQIRGEWNEHHADFEATRKKFPIHDEKLTATFERSASSLFLDVKGTSGVTGAEFFPWDSGVLANAAPQRLENKPEGIRLALTVDSQRVDDIKQLPGVLVISNANAETLAYWLDTSAESTTPENTSMTATAPASLWQMLIFAFIGGLILNLMPCVFPILSIKIMGFVEQAGKAKESVRKHGWAFTLGVLISFWFLAGLLIALRAGGQQLGWGFQLQSPFFLLGLCVLLFLMALNLLGLFEVGGSLMGVGSQLSGRDGYAGSFFSGVLATIVATPCTAPFMGTAVGFALTQSSLHGLLVFTSLGLGMALPYLLLTYSPGLMRLLPRPGRWMETLKQFMAFPLLATVIWLTWVFGLQTGMDGVLRLLGALLLLASALWARHRVGNLKSNHFATGYFFVAILLAAYLGVAGAKLRAQSGVTSSADAASGIQWEPYNAERIKKLQAEGKPMFVDFTAAWCVSCQVNEKVVFSSDEVKKKFVELGVVMIKADWTNGDQEITDALAAFDRSGIPFYLLYGKTPGAPPRILPEVLTPAIVLEALDKL